MPSLRLHRDEVDVSDPGTTLDADRTFKFPVEAVSRGRLVAGKVSRSPLEEDDLRPRLRLECGGGDERGFAEDTDPDVERSPQIIRQIETTLEHMQRRLDDFRREVDDVLKFPDLRARDGDLPPAA